MGWWAKHTEGYSPDGKTVVTRVFWLKKMPSKNTDRPFGVSGREVQPMPKSKKITEDRE